MGLFGGFFGGGGGGGDDGGGGGGDSGGSDTGSSGGTGSAAGGGYGGGPSGGGGGGGGDDGGGGDSGGSDTGSSGGTSGGTGSAAGGGYGGGPSGGGGGGGGDDGGGGDSGGSDTGSSGGTGSAAGGGYGGGSSGGSSGGSGSSGSGGTPTDRSELSREQERAFSGQDSELVGDDSSDEVPGGDPTTDDDRVTQDDSLGEQRGAFRGDAGEVGGPIADTSSGDLPNESTTDNDTNPNTIVTEDAEENLTDEQIAETQQQFTEQFQAQTPGRDIGRGDVQLDYDPDRGVAVGRLTSIAEARVSSGTPENADPVPIGTGQGDVLGRRTDTTDLLNVDIDGVGNGTAAIQPSADRQPDSEIDSVFGESDTNSSGGLTVGGTTIVAAGDDFPDSAGELPAALSGGGELLQSDIPATQAGRRDAISDSLQTALNLDPGNIGDAPLRSGVQAGREGAANLLGLNDTNTTDTTDSSDSGVAAGGVAGAAGLAVAAPEPVSSTIGAGVLGGLALGGSITAIAGQQAELPTGDRNQEVSELGGVAERSDLPGEQTVEIDVPEETPSSTSGELDTPNQDPSDTTGEIDTPGQDSGTAGVDEPISAEQAGLTQQSGQTPEIDEEETEPEIANEDIPADPFGESPQERGGTPDRFIRDDRSAFVFPGSSSSTATVESVTETTGATTESTVGAGSAGRSGIDIGLGIGNRSAVVTDQQSGADVTANGLNVTDALTQTEATEQATQAENQFANLTQNLNQNASITPTISTRTPRGRGTPRRVPTPELEIDSVDTSGLLADTGGGEQRYEFNTLSLLGGGN